ncbi:transcription factor RFX4-like [Tubulanus polymorphus]|uniref:transcription factor RFX4-like n=1 Tax=Tubulanus polymorphus TaxID=672921 RepID=UPI003DA4B8BE
MAMDTCMGEIDYEVIDEVDDCPEDHKENHHITGRKPHSTPLTLKWLEENYEVAEGVCIPRSTLYMHYLDFCNRNTSQPVNAASFGKIIRQQFPQITTRRLGTRGQSKYHYYGIAIRESSQYFELIYSKKGAQSCLGSEGHKNCNRHTITYNPRSKLGTLLPEFPSVNETHLPLGLAQDKVSTFLMMYRTHCQRILDTVIRANFEEVQSFLLHFWQGMPPHLVPILDSATIVSLVGVCDSILYKVLANVLVPSVLQQVPESLTQVIRKFSTQFDEWLKQALYGLPENLRSMKLDLSRRFSYLLRRQISLNHLCHASRSVIHCGDVVNQMLADWHRIDTSSICKQTLYTMDSYNEKEYEIVYKLCREFEFLLEEQAPLESYTEWLDSLVDRCVVQTSMSRPGSLRKSARQFLLMWSCFGTRVIRDMTLHSAPSFGSFHLIHLMFDDYVLYLIENLHTNEHANELYRTVRGETSIKQQHNNHLYQHQHNNTNNNNSNSHIHQNDESHRNNIDLVNNIPEDESLDDAASPKQPNIITSASQSYRPAVDHQEARSSCQMDALSSFSSNGLYEYNSCHSSQTESMPTSQFCEYTQVDDYAESCMKYDTSPDIMTSSIKDDWLQAYDSYYSQGTRVQNTTPTLSNTGYENTVNWLKPDQNIGNGYPYCQTIVGADCKGKPI